MCVSSRIHGHVVCSTSFEVEDCKPDLPSFKVIFKSDLRDETYESAFVFTIKVREEFVDARPRDQVVFRERKALRIKRPGLNTSQGGLISRLCSVR